MSTAQALQMAIQEVIESHVKTYQLTYADVIGALRVCLCYEEGALGVRLAQAMINKMPNVQIEALPTAAPERKL